LLLGPLKLYKPGIKYIAELLETSYFEISKICFEYVQLASKETYYITARFETRQGNTCETSKNNERFRENAKLTGFSINLDIQVSKKKFLLLFIIIIFLIRNIEHPLTKRKGNQYISA
jgi:hypothetical protein